MPGATAIKNDDNNAGEPDPVESLNYVRAMLAELRTICIRIDEEMLAYLIEMAMLEAAERGTNPPPPGGEAGHRPTGGH